MTEQKSYEKLGWKIGNSNDTSKYEEKINIVDGIYYKAYNSDIRSYSIVFFENRVYVSLNLKAWVLRAETKEEFLKKYHVSDVDLEYYKPKRKKLEKKIKELNHYRNSGFVLLNNVLEDAEVKLAGINEALYGLKD